jgi:hypothetical protein
MTVITMSWPVDKEAPLAMAVPGPIRAVDSWQDLADFAIEHGGSASEIVWDVGILKRCEERWGAQK